MTESRPLDVTRKDGALVPKQPWLFDRLFAEGRDYTIEIHEQRSTKSQNHYHAAIREAWKNLPEEMSKRFPDPDHLRKWALINTGWAIERTVACESADVAAQVAAVAGRLDESAVVIVQNDVVTIAVAKSQKTTGPGAMNREEFQKSKSDVLEHVANMIGVDVSTLSAQVSNSSAAEPSPPHSDRTDTPAASSNAPYPSGGAAGVAYIEAPSLLPPDWRDTYIVQMTGPTTRAMSVPTRDHNATQMIGPDFNEAEREWMRRVATLTVKRDKGKLKPGEFEVELEKLRTIPLSEIMVARHAA